MTDFSQKLFVDLGQTLYTEWLKSPKWMINGTTISEQGRRDVSKLAAQFAFEAAEEFVKVFCNQEDN